MLMFQAAAKYISQLLVDHYTGNNSPPLVTIADKKHSTLTIYAENTKYLFSVYFLLSKQQTFLFSFQASA